MEPPLQPPVTPLLPRICGAVEGGVEGGVERTLDTGGFHPCSWFHRRSSQGLNPPLSKGSSGGVSTPGCTGWVKGGLNTPLARRGAWLFLPPPGVQPPVQIPLGTSWGAAFSSSARGSTPRATPPWLVLGRGFSPLHQGLHPPCNPPWNIGGECSDECGDECGGEYGVRTYPLRTIPSYLFRSRSRFATACH